MPKREPTPPLADDTKYLSVVNPYPLHCNPVILEELLVFARWVSACIPQDDLTAVYYRPKSPSLLIIEVQKSCREINRFLGAHAWKDFLKKPTSTELAEQSRVYYCKYACERDVQKHGWKGLDVQEFWFEGYNPATGPFKLGNDYPKTSFCEVPPETQAEFAPCRPLPVDVFPRAKPPPIRRTIVPGSDLYVKTKKDGTYDVPKPVAPKPVAAPTNAWSRVVAPKPVRAPSSYAQSTSGSDSGSVEVIMSHAHTLPPGLRQGAPPPPPPGLSLPATTTTSRSSYSQNISRAPSSAKASSVAADDEDEDGDGEEDKDGLYEPRASSVITDISNKMHAVAIGGKGSRIGNRSGTSWSTSSASSASPVKPVLWSDYPWSDPVMVAQEGGEEEDGYSNNKVLAQVDVRVQASTEEEEEDDGEENLWAHGQPKRPTDWDKLICPVHQVKCSATCEVVSKIKAQKKRELEMAAHGRENANARGKVRGRGRGRGQAKGRKNNFSSDGGGGWH